jgi:hypothetical protein
MANKNFQYSNEYKPAMPSKAQTNNQHRSNTRNKPCFFCHNFVEKRSTNSYYSGGAGSSKFDYDTGLGGYGGYKTTYGGGSSRSRRDRGDVNIKYFGADNDAIYTGEDFETGAQEQEPALPDEDFLPQKRPETDDIVKEKTVGARIIVNQQSNVIEKLKNTSKVRCGGVAKRKVGKIQNHVVSGTGAATSTIACKNRR